MTGRAQLLRALAVSLSCSPLRLFSQQDQGGSLIWRGLISELAVEVRALDGTVRIGAAGESQAVTVSLRATDVRRFADSVAKRMVMGRRGDSVWSLRMEEPGQGAGALSFGRSGGDAKRRPLYRLFIADDVVGTIRQDLALGDAQLLLKQLRLAATRAGPKAEARRAPVKRPVKASSSPRKKP